MIVDFHLAKAPSGIGEQERDFGKGLSDAQKQAAQEWADHIGAFLPQPDDLKGLPDGSWLLNLEFTLNERFTSKSEIEFHEIQNLIVRDHLTGLPTVKPTTWKGHLVFAAQREGLEDHVRERLFGTIRTGESGQAGRLRFFPTFFMNETAREVITPLQRDRRTPARGPIYIEVIAPGQKAKFCLLYVPLPKGANWYSGQIAEDLLVASRATRAMLLDYGFSAKKTSGWGVVADSLVSGVLTAKGSQWPEAKTLVTAAKSFVEPDQAFMKFMEQSGEPIAQLKKATGQWLSNNEFRASGLNVGSLGVYRKFRDWYENHGAEWVRRLAGQSSDTTIPLRTHEFQKITELVGLADKLASSLKGDASG
jgi:CRISPR-associated protein Cmr2